MLTIARNPNAPDYWPSFGRAAFQHNIKGKIQKVDWATVQYLEKDMHDVSLAQTQGDIDGFERTLSQKKLAYFQALSANCRHAEISYAESALVYHVVQHFDHFDLDLYKNNCSNLRQYPTSLDKTLSTFKNERKAHLQRTSGGAPKPSQNHVLNHTAGAGCCPRHPSTSPQLGPIQVLAKRQRQRAYRRTSD